MRGYYVLFYYLSGAHSDLFKVDRHQGEQRTERCEEEEVERFGHEQRVIHVGHQSVQTIPGGLLTVDGVSLARTRLSAVLVAASGCRPTFTEFVFAVAVRLVIRHVTRGWAATLLLGGLHNE